MTLEEMRQEVTERGYDYTSNSARITASLKRGYERICARHDWPFLHTTVEGTAPLDIPDVRKVLSVRDTTNDVLLKAVSYSYLVTSLGDPAEAGSPECWYLDGNTIRTYPVGTPTLSVRYARVPPVLSDSSTPLIPARWQYLIVDLCVVDLLRDDDEYEAARALRNDVTEELHLMAGDLLHRNYQEPRTVLRSGDAQDYL